MKNDCNKTIEAEYKQSLPAKLSIEKKLLIFIVCFRSKKLTNYMFKYINRPKISNQIQILSHSTIWFIHEVYNNSLFGGLFIMTYIVRLLFSVSDDHIQLILMWNLCTISYY